jgi:formiminoglutamate deiminase
MTNIFARDALTANGWRSNVRLSIADGRIRAIADAERPAAGDDVVDTLLPGVANLHSHAFQRGMAGLAEVRGDRADSFWTWREQMYRFALGLGPDAAESVAAQLFVEMLEAGFTRVGEFHYLHHAPDGRPYDDVAEMAGRIAAAAAATGIGLTLLPTFYAHATFGGADPIDGQRRFVTSPDGFARLVEASRRHVGALDGAVVGIAPHSLRAVTPEELALILPIAGDGPIHMHAAEQTKEVDDCLAWSGMRPVEWLLAHQPLDRRWCLIHATHMTEDETLALAKRGAIAGLCPITEANLGDGIFNGATFLGAGGRFGIGSDSNILIGVGDELRQLEHGQRLRHRARNVLAEAGGSTGETLLRGAVQGGAQALTPGAAAGICDGASADLVALDMAHPAFAGRRRSAAVDAWIFAAHGGVRDVWSRGRHVVRGGHHIGREAIAARFRTEMDRFIAA